MYSPARLPEDTMATIGVLVRAWIWARPGKEAVLSHCTGELRHEKYAKQKAGKENRNTCGDAEKRDELGYLLSCLHGVRCLALLSVNLKGWNI